MQVILSALREEKKQAKNLIRRYKKELKTLLPGSFFIRCRGKNRYGYSTFSERGRIQQRYLGRLSEEEIKKYRAMMERKKKLRELRNTAQKQLDFLEKSLRHARKKSKRSS